MELFHNKDFMCFVLLYYYYTTFDGLGVFLIFFVQNRIHYNMSAGLRKKGLQLYWIQDITYVQYCKQLYFPFAEYY